MQASTPAPPAGPSVQQKPPPPMKGDGLPPSVDEKKESPSADGYIQHDASLHQVPTMPMNGGMPPQQVYVNTMTNHGMTTGLEAQFQAVGIDDVHNVVQQEDEGDEGGDEGDDEDEPVKLFVGQVRTPRKGLVGKSMPAHFFLAKKNDGEKKCQHW